MNPPNRIQGSFLGQHPVYIYIHTYTYVQIYMAVTSIGGPKRVSIIKIPNFIVKDGQQKPPQNRGGFCCIFGSSFSISCPFPLVSPSFLLFHAILKPQNSPPNEVTSIFKGPVVCHLERKLLYHRFLEKCFWLQPEAK